MEEGTIGDSQTSEVIGVGSRNGCTVNDTKVDEIVLSNGDVISIGSTTFIFEIGAEERPLLWKDDLAGRIFASVRPEEAPFSAGETGTSVDLLNESLERYKKIYEAAQIIGQVVEPSRTSLHSICRAPGSSLEPAQHHIDSGIQYRLSFCQ